MCRFANRLKGNAMHYLNNDLFKGTPETIVDSYVRRVNKTKIQK